jgi:hypothetical protein
MLLVINSISKKKYFTELIKSKARINSNSDVLVFGLETKVKTEIYRCQD